MNELEAAFARRRSAAATTEENPPSPKFAPAPAAPQHEFQNVLSRKSQSKDKPKIPDAIKENAVAADSPGAAIDALIASSNVEKTQTAYASLLKTLNLEKKPTISKLCEMVLEGLPHKSKQLLTTLEARAARVAAVANQPKRRAVVAVAVVGAGPVGLRTAIELAMLGARVEVLEARDGFSRLQVLHLWEWVEADLIDLGVKYMDPSIFASTDVRRCTTMQLQHSLLKIALLLGVRVRFGCKVAAESVGSLYLKRVDVLVDASGARCPLLDNLGFGTEVALKSQRALCIVLSLLNSKTPEEQAPRESTWASQFYQQEFGALQAKGVNLENLVYYRSSGSFADSATHYFVTTTTADALVAWGALKSAADALPNGADDLCAPSNVDLEKLESYMRAGVEAFVPSLAQHPMCPGQLNLFDFCERKQSNKAVALVGGAAVGSKQDTPCIVTRVGDALQEPFWPEGLGINRGFLGAYDCADLVLRAAPLLITELGKPPATLDDFAPCMQRREAMYALLKRVSGANRQKELKPHFDGTLRKFAYNHEPGTRYVSWSEAGGGRDAAALGAKAKAAAPAGGPPRMTFHVRPSPRA